MSFDFNASLYDDLDPPSPKKQKQQLDTDPKKSQNSPVKVTSHDHTLNLLPSTQYPPSSNQYPPENQYPPSNQYPTGNQYPPQSSQYPSVPQHQSQSYSTSQQQGHSNQQDQPSLSHVTDQLALGKMFIGGLKWETTQEKLKAYFGKFGHIIECVIMTDNFTGRSRGFGFVTFEDPKVLDRVLKQDHTIDGKIVDPKRAVPKDEQDKTEKIFVGGIPMDVTNDEFGEYFEKYGVVLDASLMFDKNTGRSRGFGFITFDDSEAVNMVMAAQADKELRMHGRRIEIKQATPRLRQGVSQDGNGPNRRKTNRFEPYKKPLGLPIHSAYGGPTIDKLTYQRLGPQNGQTIDNRSYGRHSSRSSSPTRDEYVVELTRK